MPIKIPKSFARRKSSGNAFDEVQNAPAPSFRVFEKPPGGNRSWDGTHAMKQASQVRTYGAKENDYDEHLFPVNKDESRNRGSGGTNNSASTAPYGSAASSARLSSSSTIPSSTDISNDSHANSMVSGQRPLQDIPVPPAARSRGWSFKNAGRTFSLANKPRNDVAVEPLPPPFTSPHSAQNTKPSPPRRERAMTASTASTATPPRLLDGELAFGDSDMDNFGNMFDSIGVPKSRNSDFLHDAVETDLPSFPHHSEESPTVQHPHPLSPPLEIERARVKASSPYSKTSRESTDGPMGAPPSTHIQSRSNPSSPTRRKALPIFPSMPVPQAPSSPLHDAHSNSRHRSGIPVTKSPSPVEDEDTRLLAGAGSCPDDCPQNGTQAPIRRKFEPTKATDVKNDLPDGNESLFATASPNRPNTLRQAPKRVLPRNTFGQSNTGAVDSPLADSVRRKAQSGASGPFQEQPIHKLTSPAKFEGDNAEQDPSRHKSDISHDDSVAGERDKYEGEGDMESDHEAAKQRRRQEARLAVYRQTMMRVSSESSNGPGSTGGQAGQLTSPGTPELSRTSHGPGGTGVASHSGKGNGTDDEDEDIPLGILAAHGFPNRNRGPSRLQGSLSNSNLRSSVPLSAPPASVSGPPASVSGESRAGPRANLPVFARNLPQDPYYGASPGIPPNREVLPMGGWQPPLGGVPPGLLHPSGLVGVIAGEERARAMRRGSPNQQVSHDNFIPSQHPGMMGRSPTMLPMSNLSGYPGLGIPGMMSPPALSPGDQAQIQMAQQMMQMMQMQMQWMQQMTQMQQNGQSGQMVQPPPTGMMPMSNLISTPGELGNHVQRPFSVPLPESGRQIERAMSLTPGMANQWNRNSSYTPSMAGGQGGYAPSIAPSERNAVGLASRYRPVSISAESVKPSGNRASTFTSRTLQQWTGNSGQSRLSPSNTNAAARSPSTSALGRNAVTLDEEDDDQGWAEMTKKRDQRKGIWKMKKHGKSDG